MAVSRFVFVAKKTTTSLGFILRRRKKIKYVIFHPHYRYRIACNHDTVVWIFELCCYRASQKTGWLFVKPLSFNRLTVFRRRFPSISSKFHASFVSPTTTKATKQRDEEERTKRTRFRRWLEQATSSKQPRSIAP